MMIMQVNSVNKTNLLIIILQVLFINSIRLEILTQINSITCISIGHEKNIIAVTLSFDYYMHDCAGSSYRFPIVEYYYWNKDWLMFVNTY